MPGVFKKLNASDVKITPFEAHKQYSAEGTWESIGANTSSLAWSGKNKNTFTTGSRKYYQLDKLYYRNYIQERAHRLELDDATYTTQERRLYQSASLLSLSQKTFGSEVQPNSFEISGSSGSIQFNLKDDGFGNLYDVNVGKENFPNEDNRVFYLAPVGAFKRADLTYDIETGDNYVKDAGEKVASLFKETATELGYLKEDSRTDAEKGKDVDYIPHTSKDPSVFGNPDAKMYDSPNIKVNPKYDDFSKNDLEKLETNINKITGGRGRESARVSDRGNKIRIKFSFMRDEFDEKTWNKILDYLKEKNFEILDQSNYYEANYDREEPAEAVPTINLKK